MSTSQQSQQDNVLIIHWHDLGRHLTSYGVDGVVSPHTDKLASDGFLFTDAHATAPLCSPSRGSVFSGQYPHSNGIVGLAHHGWEYHDEVQTLPEILADHGWYSALFGMQHETSHPKRLGYDNYDVSNSYCDHVTSLAQEFLVKHRDGTKQPFLLTAGFFETHRPYPASEYDYADPASVTIPPHLPDTPEVREDLAGFYGSITKADAAVGRLLSTLDELGYAENTWVVFFTDHGAAFPREKSTLYAGGTGIAFMIRPPKGRGIEPRVYDDLFSGVDVVPTVLDLIGLPIPESVQGVSHAPRLVGDAAEPSRSEVFTEKTFHDSFDPIRAVRTKDFSYIVNYVEGPELDLPLDIQDSLSGQAVQGQHDAPRAEVELYDLRNDPDETTNVANLPEYAQTKAQLGALLDRWRQDTGDELPDTADGRETAALNMANYLAAVDSPTEVQRSALGSNRRYSDSVIV